MKEEWEVTVRLNGKSKFSHKFLGGVAYKITRDVDRIHNGHGELVDLVPVPRSEVLTLRAWSHK